MNTQDRSKKMAGVSMGWVRWASMLAICGLAAGALAQQAADKAQEHEEKRNMELVGYNDLQGRGAYQPIVAKQGDRYIAYVGAQTGTPARLNPLTGKVEFSGTSIVDVTDPANPKYLAHIPGETRPNAGFQPSGTAFAPGKFPPGEAEFQRVCSGADLPNAPDKSKYYMLRVYGHSAWQMWDVTDPAKPVHLNDILTGLTGTHRPAWECKTGIAFLPAGLLGWPVPPAYAKRDSADHLTVWDLSNPTKPKEIREWGLPGQEKGSKVPYPHSGLHIVSSGGPDRNRVYITFGNDSEGIWLILDRDKLLHGPKEPTDANLQYPIITRVDLPPDVGAHTMIPMPHMFLPAFANQAGGSTRDFMVVVPQQVGIECQKGNDGQDGSRQLLHFYDVTTETRPIGIAAWWVPESPGNFCSRGGRFGPHAAMEEPSPIFNEKVLLVTYFNAGLRAVDVRDPYHPKEVGYYIPALNPRVGTQCAVIDGQKSCKRAIQTNNVTVDDRGYIYIVDHDGAGLDILQLTGEARKIADYSKAVGSPESRGE